MMIGETESLQQRITAMGVAARAASKAMAKLSAGDRRRILLAVADGLERRRGDIAAANDIDMKTAGGLSEAMLDRLKLNDARIDAMIAGVRQIAGLPDVLGRILETRQHANGMRIEKVRAPLGVIGIIYESRPNVTADAAALCFKAGSAVILRGGSEASNSNRAILEAMVEGGGAAGLPEHAVQLIDTSDRAAVEALLRMDTYVDLIVPRGGESLIRAVAEHSKVPVLKHYKGVCHVYVDRAADLEMAERIVINAKCQRPGVCNAMETLLIHRDIADAFALRIADALTARGVELRGDVDFQMLAPQAKPATEDDWYEEYLALILAVRIVDDLEQAIEHITQFGTQHTDVIVTDDKDAAEQFVRDVDSATVYINASSRFTDGGEFGMGAEIGISTDKLHARGPCGIEELTTYKWIIRGSGQVRQ